MNQESRREVEAHFSQAIVQFEKDYLGRGPLEVQTWFLEDMILVRLHRVLTPAEQKLAKTVEGQHLVKETRRRLFESARPLLEAIVLDVTGCNLVSMHTDISTKTGERVIVMTVDGNLAERYRGT
jgi:uncharacterized protein YbcI